MKILLVDDNITDRKLLREILEHEGYEVTEAPDGQEGLSLCKSEKPDIIISDILMPVMDGFNFLRAVKKDNSLKSVPFLFYSAVYTGRIEADLAGLLGAVAHIVKPKDPDEFLAELEAALDRLKALEKTLPAVNIMQEEEYLRRYSFIVAAKLEEKVKELEHYIEEHRNIESSYRLMFESNPHPMWVYDLETLAFLKVNNAAIYQYGYTKEEFLSMTIKDIRPAEDVPALLENVSKVTSGIDVAGVWRHRKKDGKIIYVEIISHTINFMGRPAELVLAHNITDRKKAEDELRESEQRFRAINDSVIDSIISIDSRSRIIFCNRATEKMFGYSMDELVGQDVSRLMPEQYREPHRKGVEKYLATGKFTYIGSVREFLGMRKDGSEFPVELSLSTWKSGEQVYFTGVIRDITERKLAEETLRVSEEKYHNIMDHAADAILIADMDGTLLDANKKAEELLGYAKEELLELNYQMIHPKEEISRTAEAFNEIVLRGYTYLKDGAILRKDGQTVPVDITGSLIAYSDRLVLQGIFRDITERRRIEEEKQRLREQLVQSQKMEAIGQLAGGIAHDFNNILTAIITYGYFLKTKLPDDDPLKNHAIHILELSEKAASLTQSLLAFSRKQLLHPQLVNLNELVRNVEKFLYRVIGEDIELRTVLSDRDLIIVADHVQIEQVLMNLATNARDAMPEGGILKITTDLMTMDSAFVNLHGYGAPGNYALISVTDTGQGMDEKTLSKIFEPFFTTKDLGKGTGLGLAMVYGIVKQHNGFINVYSEPGRGTAFRIYFPLSDAFIQKPEPVEDSHIHGGTETILLAEDNPEVRAGTKALLEEFGYTVIEAEDGETAFLQFRSLPEKIKLVILDLIMPGMNGKETYEEMQKIKPGVKALFTSGYAEDIMLARGVITGETDFIVKPAPPSEFLTKIREIIDRQ